jgi:amino acid transporter
MDEPSARPPGRFGTFGGVFTPSVLTILGVIMFMRAGFVVGNSGIYFALGILAFSKGITGLTSLSLSAIATNTEVGPGGNYFMISRSLGPDIGGTIGITLFISQAVAIAFYVIGFSEALYGLIGTHYPDAAVTIAQYNIDKLTSNGVIFLLFILTFKGADVALRAQYIILAVLLASVVVFLIGGAMSFDGDTFRSNTSPIDGGVGFWAAFAIFFPAATGIDAGANMSGDLKDPAKSIPSGTLMAILFTAAVYVALLIFMAGFAPAEELVADPFGQLQKMSVFGPLIIAGVFAATLSSALSSFLGAPRILQAMGKDELLKPMVFFGKGSGPADEPRRATVLSFFIAMVIVWAGGLNAIAEIISMFFLIAYGMINISAFIEGRGGNPSFRPRFKLFGWPAAITAAVGCAVAMVKINETYAILSMMLAGLIYWSLRGRTKSNWSDAWSGYTFAKTCENLFELEESVGDRKNWRPIVAAVTDDAERDKRMIEYATWIESGRGLLSVLEVKTVPDMSYTERFAMRQRGSEILRQGLAYRHVKGFGETFAVREHDDIDGILQAYSIGALRPNTVMLTIPPPGQTERRNWMYEAIKALGPMPVNVIAYKGARTDAVARNRIDIWWAGYNNGSLMAMFAYLISTHEEWKGVYMRIMRVVATGAEHEPAEQELIALSRDARIDMEVEVIISQQPVSEIIVQRSGAADLVVLGLSERALGDFEEYLAQADAMFAQLPPTILVHSGGQVDLRV